MTHWKSLPESLEPDLRRLVVEMRRLKDHSGLSLAALAARTPASKSSWARYLNGGALPSRQAVEALARATGATDVARLLALWELAAERPFTATPRLPARRREHGAAPSATAQAAPPAPSPAPAADPLPARRPAAASLDDGPSLTPDVLPPERPLAIPLLAALAAAVIAAASALLIVRPWDAGGPTAGPATPLTAPHLTGSLPTGPGAPHYPCQFYVHDGRQYAGHSTTMDAEYGFGSNGEPIAEVQCLLRRQGFDPGSIDGLFGPSTERALTAFQQAGGLPDDGLLDGRTWQALRHV